MNEIESAILLSRAKGVGAAAFRKLIDEFGLPSLALRNWQERLQGSVQLSEVSIRKSDISDKIARTIEAIQNGSISACYYSQMGYPRQLSDLGEPPPLLFCRGKLAERPMAAIVGARKSTAAAEKATEKIVAQLAAKGFCIVSGGAIGVDSAAHNSALRIDAPTIAVLATGLDVAYPAANRELFDKIAIEGALLTEMMLGAQPARSFFPTRNRLIAALADVIVVVQATEKSGSLITADWGKRLGRKILTIEPQTNCRASWSGNLMLQGQGAELINI